MAKVNQPDPFITLTEEGKRNLERMQVQLDQSRKFLNDAKEAGIDNPALRAAVENGQRMIDLLKKNQT
jgi:hypothetical protein